MDLETAAEFMTERRDFLFFHVVPSAGGSGWDVVLRVDGTYIDRADAEAVAASFREGRGQMADVTGQPEGGTPQGAAAGGTMRGLVPLKQPPANNRPLPHIHTQNDNNESADLA